MAVIFALLALLVAADSFAQATVTVPIGITPVAVTGTFFQATQPVSLADNAARLLGQVTFVEPQAVTGTFWQATQPVSGTFWQTTQPVSLASVPAHAITSIANPVAVTGTFWQSTQPVSGTVTVTDGAGAVNIICDSGCGGAASFEDNDPFTPNTTSVNVMAGEVDDTATTAITENSAGALRMSTRRELYGQIRDAAGNERGANVTAGGALVVDGSAATQPVSGTFWQSTQPVSGTFWQATQPISGTVTANAGTGTFTVGDGAGALNVICDSGCGGAATFVDGAATFTQESSSVNAPSGFVFDDTVGTALAENDIAAARITAARAQVMRVEGVTRGTYATLTGTSVDVNCTGGCGSPATSNIVSLSISESVAAPTALTWYQKRDWLVPSGVVYVPTRAFSSVTTAGTRTMIAIHNVLGTFNVSTNGFTDGNSVVAPRHYARLFACVTTVLSAVATNVTVTYTDELGNTGNTTTALVIPASAPVGNCFEFVLAATTGAMRDVGVRDVTAVSDTAAPTGVIEIVGHNVLLDTQGAANALEQTTYDTGVAADPEHICIMFFQAAVTAQQRTATITGSVR